MQSLSSGITSGLTYTFAIGLGTYAVMLRVGPFTPLDPYYHKHTGCWIHVCHHGQGRPCSPMPMG